jgi:hypothetical protein
MKIYDKLSYLVWIDKEIYKITNPGLLTRYPGPGLQFFLTMPKIKNAPNSNQPEIKTLYKSPNRSSQLQFPLQPLFLLFRVPVQDQQPNPHNFPILPKVVIVRL